MIFLNKVTIAPDVTFGKDLKVPGISLIISNRFLIRGDIAYHGEEETPSFTFGLLF